MTSTTDNIAQNYQLLTAELGHGAFGRVRLGLDKVNQKLVAIKIEDKTKSKRPSDYLLKAEYKAMIGVGNTEQVLALWEDNRAHYMAMNLLGPSLSHMHKICGRTFSLETTLELIRQMIHISRHHHEAGFLHRDIKPDNYLVDYSIPHRKIHLVDMGLSKHIEQTNRAPKRHCTRVGSMRYMSPHCHDRIEPSYRDDMYSIGYVILYFFNGSLPWSADGNGRGDKGVAHESRYDSVATMKRTMSHEQLTENVRCWACRRNKVPCSFRGFMLQYFNTVAALKFGQRPDYDRILEDLQACHRNHGCPEYGSGHPPFPWDWNKYYMIGQGGMT